MKDPNAQVSINWSAECRLALGITIARILSLDAQTNQQTNQSTNIKLTYPRRKKTYNLYKIYKKKHF